MLNKNNEDGLEMIAIRKKNKRVIVGLIGVWLLMISSLFVALMA